MYRIIGSDQKIYGPVSSDQIRRWIAEGRVNNSTLASAEGSTEWRPILSFPDFSVPPLPISMPPSPVPRTQGGSNGMATAGFVFGLLSILLFWMCCFDTIFAVLGVVFSSIALNRSKGQDSGKSLALAGLILSIIGLAKNTLFGLVMALFSAGPHWLHRWNI